MQRESKTRSENMQRKNRTYIVNLQNRKLKMPGNTWGSTILATLMFKTCLSSWTWASRDFIIVGGLQIFGLVCSVMIQLVLTYFLIDLADARHAPTDKRVEKVEKCNPEQTFATFACALLLQAQVMANDFRESIEMLIFINQIPHYDAKKHEDTLKTSSTAVVVQFQSIDDEQENVGAPQTGIYLSHRLVLHALVFLRFYVVGTLAVVSFDFIMRTEELEEILLNCTATLFICEVDEICFKLFNPSSLQELFQGCPAFREPSYAEMIERIHRCIAFCRSQFLLKGDEREEKLPASSQTADKALQTEWTSQMKWQDLLGIALTACFSPVCTFFTASGLYAFYCGPDFVHVSQDPDSWNLRVLSAWVVWVCSTFCLTVFCGFCFFAFAVGCHWIQIRCSCCCCRMAKMVWDSILKCCCHRCSKE